MPIQTTKPAAEFHPKKRREVLAAADVAIRQVRVIDKDGQYRNIVYWQCGDDRIFAETMDGLFDQSRRFKAPQWLVDGVANLPSEMCFNADGSSKAGVRVLVKSETMTAAPISFDDDDVPGAAQ